MGTKKVLVLFLLLLTVLQVSVIAAAGPALEKPLEFYKHTVYTSEDGLPQNSIFAITQTPDGFIWLATNAGLARFDGVEFEVFNKKKILP